MRQIKILVLAVCALFALSGCGKGQKAYDKGMELAEQGKYKESLKQFEAAIQENKEQTEYYIGYGMALNRLNRYEEAKEEFQKAMQDTENQISKENNKQLYYGMAISEYGLGEYKSVDKYCKKALEIGYLAELDDDIRYTRLAALELLGEWKRAKKECQTIIKENKNYMEAYMELAKIERELGDNEEVKQAYLDAISVKKDYYDAYFGLYEQYCIEGNSEEAEEMLAQLVTIRSNKAANLVVIGRAYYCQKNYDKAKEYLKMAYDANSKDSLYYLGMVELAEGSTQEAIQNLEKYCKEKKEEIQVEVYDLLAQAYCDTGDYDKAQESVTKGLSYGSSSAVKSLKRSQVILYEKQNKYKEAKKAAKEYLKNYPEDTQMQKELSFIETRIK